MKKCPEIDRERARPERRPEEYSAYFAGSARGRKPLSGISGHFSRLALGLALSFVLWASAACGQDFVRPPVARIHLDPAYVALGDAMTTRVTLDGSESEDTFNDPANPLTYAWSFDDEYAVDAGGVDQPVLVARFAADHPVTATLTVTNPTGQSSTAQARIGVLLPPP